MTPPKSPKHPRSPPQDVFSHNWEKMKAALNKGLRPVKGKKQKKEKPDGE